jgi:hypothetical protein
MTWEADGKQAKATLAVARVAKKAIYLGQVEAADAGEVRHRTRAPAPPNGAPDRDGRLISARAKEHAMIIEGRTITIVAEMLEFCLEAISRTGVDPSDIRLRVHVDEFTLSDGSKVYDVLISPAA